MKILYFISTLSGGGAERVMSTVANHFANKPEYDITIVTDTSQPIVYDISDNVRFLDLEKGRPYPNGFLARPIHFINTLYTIFSIYKREKPDVVISFQTGMNGMVNLALCLTWAKIISSEHSYYNWKYTRIEEFMRKYFYRRANALTVLTRHDLNICKGLGMTNVVYMPNPICLSGDVHQEKRTKNILAAGRLDAWEIKGFDMLIQIWGKVCHEYPDWTLQIAGNGSDASAKCLKEFSKRHNCINIEFLGFRKDIKQILQRTSVFVLTSRHEGSPMVLLEAMCSGCCCVAFDCETGPNEIISDKRSGLLVDAENVDQFVSKLRLVLSNDKLREKYAGRAPESVARFGEEQVMKRWESLLNKIVKK